MAMAGSGTRIYAAIAGMRIIDVVDTEQYAVTDRITIDVQATSLAVSPREDILYVGSGNGVAAIAIREKKLASSAASNGTSSPRQMTFWTPARSSSIPEPFADAGCS